MSQPIHRRNISRTVAPNTIDPVIEPWVARAHCIGADVDVFFPERGGKPKTAKEICAACPVRAACLTYALEHNEPFGVWGGLSHPERRRLLKQSA